MVKSWVNDASKKVDWVKRYDVDGICYQFRFFNWASMDGNNPNLVGEAALAFEKALDKLGLEVERINEPDLRKSISSLTNNLLRRIAKSQYDADATMGMMNIRDDKKLVSELLRSSNRDIESGLAEYTDSIDKSFAQTKKLLDKHQKTLPAKGHSGSELG